MHTEGMNPDTALQQLMSGNERYVKGATTHPNQSIERRTELAGGQHPVAAILTCSDSRVAPEILFDQGLGDVFIIRNAGNVVEDVGLGSIEYALEHLGTRLVVVLGHAKCGAVTAATQGSEAPGHIDSIVKHIQPAVQLARSQSGDLVANSIKANVGIMEEKLKASEPFVAKMVKDGSVKVVGAVYDLASGAVTLV